MNEQNIANENGHGSIKKQQDICALAQNKFNKLQEKCPKIDVSLSDEYKELGYWQEDTFSSAFSDLCEKNSHHLAVIDGDRQFCFFELQQRVNCVASNLQAKGLEAGDCVILQLPNTVEFIELIFAFAMLGIIPVLALPTHRHLEISNFCKFTQAKAYFIQDFIGHYDYRCLAKDLTSEHEHLSHIFVKGDAQELYSIDELYKEDSEAINLINQRVDINSQDVVCFQISGGTTGIPKLIPRRHTEYLYNIRTCANASGMSPCTVYLCVLPVEHNFAFACPGVMGCLFSGGTTVLSTDPSPEHCFSLIEKNKVTITSLVPPLVIFWRQFFLQTKNTSNIINSLEVLQVGGSKLSYEIAKHIEVDFGCRLQQVFGMAEGLICFTGLHDNNDLIHHTQGKPMSAGDEIRIVDNEENSVLLGETGQLLTRGPYTISGYYNMPEHNKNAFTEDGFYRTGDMVKQTLEGYLLVAGRNKDLINRGGEKIVPEEVENILLSYEKIIDVAVLGLPDELYGEAIHAFIITKENVKEESSRQKMKKPEIVRFLKAQGLADYKVPDYMHFVNDFPSTGVGKVNKKLLRENIRQSYQSL